MPYVPGVPTDDQEVSLYVEDVGTGPAVVLLHHWPVTSQAWEPQIAPLVDSGRAAVHASSQIVNFWAVFQTKQESVVRAIAQSAAADVAGLVRMHLNAGARAWEQLAAYARSLKIP